MPASSIDFDVITGPSTPREPHDAAPQHDKAPVTPSGAQPAAPRNR